MTQIINSILDTDLYKLTMQMAVVEHFPRAKVRYSFINRANTEFPEGFAEELRKQVKFMEKLKLKKDERKFLEDKCYFLTPTYLDFLLGYRYNSSEVGIIQTNGKLEISIEGYWYKTILWEVPLMAMISELYFKMTNHEIEPLQDRIKKNIAKGVNFAMNNMKLADFGTRRRYSYVNHVQILEDLCNVSPKGYLVGTSNVHFAKEFNLTPIGTHAHEWFSFHGAKYGFKMANKMAMEHWVDTFRGNLGIALTDTYTTHNFYQVTNFDRKFAKLYDGVRHDSGDPYLFVDKTLEHYELLGIEPKSKTIVFSDSLTVGKAKKIYEYCRNDIQCSFGIGTHLTNDVGVEPLNIVIKLAEVKPEGEQWIPAIKLSDVSGKNTGDKEMIEIAKKILNK